MEKEWKGQLRERENKKEIESFLSLFFIDEGFQRPFLLHYILVIYSLFLFLLNLTCVENTKC